MLIDDRAKQIAAARKALEKYIVRSRETNLPNPIQTEKDVETVLSALKVASPTSFQMMSSTLSIVKGTKDVKLDYSNMKYRLGLNTLSDKENEVLTEFLKKNLPKSAETYGSAAVRMVMGEKTKKPQDIDIQLHTKDGKLAEKLATDACDALNKPSLFNSHKFVVGKHDPRICLLPADRNSVVRLRNTNAPILDIHIEGEEGSIPKMVFEFKRLDPILIDGMKCQTVFQNQLDKMASSNTLRLSSRRRKQ